MRRSAVLVFCAALASGQNPLLQTAWNTIKEGLAEKSLEKRRRAILSLGLVGADPRGLAMLETLVRDNDPEIRETAVIALGETRAPAAVPLLKVELKDEHGEAAFNAAKALWDMGDHSGRDIIVAVMRGEVKDTSNPVKEGMRDAKSKLHNPAALAIMGVKEVGGLMLGPFGMGIPVIQELLKDGGAAARTAAVTTLAADTSPATIRNLEDALADKNWVVRAAAIRALVQRNATQTAPMIELLLSDKNDTVKYMAAGAVIRLSAAPPASDPHPPR